MTRALLAVTALGVVIALGAACSPDNMDDRNCGSWFDQYKCKNAGDSCKEIAMQLAPDSFTADGKCVSSGGALACAPVRSKAGACQAVVSCDYEPYGENRPMSCYAKCTFVNGTAVENGVCTVP